MHKLITKLFAPYVVRFIDHAGRTETHRSWTFKDALEWAACSLREESVRVYFFSRLVASRQTVEG